MRPVDRLSSCIAATAFDRLPARAVEHAKMALASTVASAAAGAAQRSTQIVGELLRSRAGARQARAWFAGDAALPVTDAARLNAMRSDAAACDDSDFRTMAHIGTAVATSAVAVGELAASSGADVLAAIVLGYEAAGRVGEACSPGLARRGIHPVVLCTFGAAAAAARVLRLDGEQTGNALALAATSASGLLASTDGWTREYQAGRAVADGTDAALAAAAGYRASAELVDGPGGALFTLAGECDPAALARDLGADWDIETELGIKMRPGGYPFAAAVEAAIDAAARADVAQEQIASIRVSGPSLPALLGARHPQDFVEAIHSLAYYIAVGIADRDFSWQSIDARRLDDPRLWGLLELVEVEPEARPERFDFHWGATVTITAHDGTRTRSTVDAPWGSARRGLSWSDVENKTRALLGRSGRAVGDAEDILARVHDLDRAPSLAQLLGAL
jgi:2-methylcitrate dehydratase PrpD